jgi:hypothetical protein
MSVLSSELAREVRLYSRVSGCAFKSTLRALQVLRRHVCCPPHPHLPSPSSFPHFLTETYPRAPQSVTQRTAVSAHSFTLTPGGGAQDRKTAQPGAQPLPCLISERNRRDGGRERPSSITSPGITPCQARVAPRRSARSATCRRRNGGSFCEARPRCCCFCPWCVRARRHGHVDARFRDVLENVRRGR